ncbi:hypothetical protein H4R99_000814 [Coemansia sp. RSA 1722]|nr:hypothetical protein IWW45_001772 [Coemansia sp. RSA 485]KAJ2605810.1 hypothetical protein H4R99_000814 [Coemansia sp. RSA 1722]KAJ2638300.1 hypothetical protein GGF40_001751 [Coemansia sp. RSA 1286]
MAIDNIVVPEQSGKQPSNGRSEFEQQGLFSWSTIQDRLRESIISIRCSSAMFFDTESPGCGNATGFVVDAEQGIVLSNRHVMGPGPSYHKGTFFNNAEVFLQPCYYDPIHDFSFFRYDPAELQSFTPKAIQLCPEKAQSGLEFRLVGNDSNEKMSVHSGELSQMDRNAPDYGSGFNDFNTFYIQASTTSKGGSSGSPVVNIEGQAVALNAGGSNQSLSCFLLPLHRIVYAFEYIRRREIPPRGTLQTVFKHITHVQAERFGLDPTAAVQEGGRTQGATGFLIVDKVLPDGPASGSMQVGDIVISINDKPIAEFPEMSAIVDAAVDQQISVKVYSGGIFRTENIAVQDLYSVTPSKILRLGGAVLHDMSLQKAVYASAPIYGVYIAIDTNGFIPEKYRDCRHVICAVNDVPTPNLDTLMDILADVKRDEPVVLTIKNMHDLRNENVVIARHPQITLPNAVFTRSSTTGFWSSAPYAGMSVSSKADSISTMSVSESEEMTTAVDSVFAKGSDIGSFADAFAQSTVVIEASSICPADNGGFESDSGIGLVLDKQLGILLCCADLATNPTHMYTVIFGGLVRVPATLAYMHPLYPVCFLKYDPALVAEEEEVVGAVAVSDLDMAGDHARSQDMQLDVGEQVTVYVGSMSRGIAKTPATVLSRSIAGSTTCDWCMNHRYFKTEVFGLAPAVALGSTSIGVVCDGKDRIGGLWIQQPTCRHQSSSGGFMVGLDISLVLPVLQSLRVAEDEVDIVRVLDVEFNSRSLATARILGVGDQHIRQMSRGPNPQSSVFMVSRILGRRGPDEPSLEVGDIVLSVDGRPVQHINDLACLYSRDLAKLKIVRKRVEQTVVLPTTGLSGINTRHVVCWAGGFMQKPWKRVLERANRIPSDVYTYTSFSGSPVNAELSETSTFVTAIDEQPVQTLDDAVRIIQALKNESAQDFNARVAGGKAFSSGMMPGRDVIVRGVTLAGQELVGTIRTNDHYFPAWQIRRGPKASDFWAWSAI